MNMTIDTTSITRDDEAAYLETIKGLAVTGATTPMTGEKQDTFKAYALTLLRRPGGRDALMTVLLNLDDPGHKFTALSLLMQLVDDEGELVGRLEWLQRLNLNGYTLHEAKQNLRATLTLLLFDAGLVDKGLDILKENDDDHRVTSLIFQLIIKGGTKAAPVWVAMIKGLEVDDCLDFYR